MKKSSKQKSVKKTPPTWFRTPYNRLWYVLVQNPKQFLASGNEHKSLCDMANKFFESNYKAMTFYATNAEGELVAAVYYPGMFEANEDEVLSVLCHECVHIWQEFAESINEQNPSREFEAYTIDEIFKNILIEYRELVSINEAHIKAKSSKKEPQLI